MITLDKISKPVEKLLAEYHNFVQEKISIDEPDSSAMLNYIFKTKGKGVRPLLTLLSASVFGELNQENKERVFLSAMIIEMVHTASLVHDDIIDEAYIRRGKPSVNALWGQKRAVLIGDYIFSRSYSVGMESGHFDIVKELCRVITEICDGELLQEKQTHSLSMTRETYNKIIYGKTASLISSCTQLGAMSMHTEEQTVLKMKEMGKNIGMAFQIQDDILDYSKTNNTGKLSGNDLKERKITLPLLCTLDSVDKKQKKEIIKHLSSIRRKPKNIDYLLEQVRVNQGLEKSTEIMKDYLNNARTTLNTLEPSPYRTALVDMCTFLEQREK